jgi:hypothetical protein
MGQSTNGVLAYGYDFGDNEPPLAGLDEYESWRPADFAPEPGSDEYYDFDFQDWATRKLMAAAGHPVDADDYVDYDATKKHYGVWFESYCSGEAPMYLLVTHEITVYRGSTVDIDFTALERQRVEEDWDDKLNAVLEVLGLGDLVYRNSWQSDKDGQPQKARWMLASYWG